MEKSSQNNGRDDEIGICQNVEKILTKTIMP